METCHWYFELSIIKLGFLCKLSEFFIEMQGCLISLPLIISRLFFAWQVFFASSLWCKRLFTCGMSNRVFCLLQSSFNKSLVIMTDSSNNRRFNASGIIVSIPLPPHDLTVQVMWCWYANQVMWCHRSTLLSLFWSLLLVFTAQWSHWSVKIKEKVIPPDLTAVNHHEFLSSFILYQVLFVYELKTGNYDL